MDTTVLETIIPSQPQGADRVATKSQPHGTDPVTTDFQTPQSRLSRYQFSTPMEQTVDTDAYPLPLHVLRLFVKALDHAG